MQAAAERLRPDSPAVSHESFKPSARAKDSPAGIVSARLTSNGSCQETEDGRRELAMGGIGR